MCAVIPGAKTPKTGAKTPKGKAAASKSSIKVDVMKPLPEEFNKASHLRARSEAWHAQAVKHDKASRARMGLAAQLGKSINVKTKGRWLDGARRCARARDDRFLLKRAVRERRSIFAKARCAREAIDFC